MKELKGTKTEKNLMEAFAGESQARNKYTYFASVAALALYLWETLHGLFHYVFSVNRSVSNAVIYIRDYIITSTIAPAVTAQTINRIQALYQEGCRCHD